MDNTRIPALDGLRGAAVLLVTMFHFLAIPDPNRGIHAIHFKVAYAGWTGVDLFFVLSGFLITTILWSSKQTPHYFRNFYMRRVLRIFPLYYGVLAVVLVVLPLIGRLRTPAVAEILRHQWLLWTYVSNFSAGRLNGDWLNLGHFWSLAIEEQFYLLWPAVIFFSTRARAIGVAAFAVLLSVGLRIALLLYALRHPDAAESMQAAVFTWTPCRLDALATGAIVALLSTESVWRRRVEIAGRSIGLIAVLMTAYLVWSDGLNRTFSTPRTVAGAIASASIYSLVALAFGALIIEATRPAMSWVSRAFSLRPLRLLGKYSYGIYVFQGLLAPAFAMMFSGLVSGAKGSDGAAIGYFFLSTSIVVVVAVISWHAYEQWFLRWKRLFPRTSTVEAGDILMAVRRDE